MTINKSMTRTVSVKNSKWEMSYKGWDLQSIDDKFKVLNTVDFLNSQVWVAGIPKTKNSFIKEVHPDYVKVYTEGSGYSNLFLDQVILHPNQFISRRKQRTKKTTKKLTKK